MEPLAEKSIHCPFCDARLTLLIDESVGAQRYTEDCHVCCQPMDVIITEDMDGELSVTVEQE
ncbi:CPXCG motif-containing cysteine-rich protein [Gilvimarinus algae]|uniref:CPXCG motif-containing cysteine-rich protein n=1 Tax=Gilvimarinus algae TaxID=3058037 RepID=A0ABT8TGH5_9GAMM|nr:CPXCG motif-containing cysteine-rich protein [Gilvimarinus sp. SDUM040014]MDO3383189.1 CPXCG motif-containing cysteine-rich protein [Gilvimarinus sp. SDUM040014]